MPPSMGTRAGTENRFRGVSSGRRAVQLEKARLRRSLEKRDGSVGKGENAGSSSEKSGGRGKLGSAENNRLDRRENLCSGAGATERYSTCRQPSGGAGRRGHAYTIACMYVWKSQSKLEGAGGFASGGARKQQPPPRRPGQEAAPSLRGKASLTRVGRSFVCAPPRSAGALSLSLSLVSRISGWWAGHGGRPAGVAVASGAPLSARGA